MSLTWLADRMRAFVDASPEHAGAVDRFATFLARDDSDGPDDWDDPDG